MMTGFAAYRLPYDNHATLLRQTTGEPEELLACAALNGRQGFVVAPFAATPGEPILLIRPDETEVIPLAPTAGSLPELAPSAAQPTQAYAIDFANYHAQLQAGAFRKIVLARCAEELTEEPADAMELFLKACQYYPRMFVALVSTAKSGTWLTATPEILLSGSGGTWHTMALAGTMKLEGEQLAGEGETLTWSTKNIQEQRYVATYVAECLEQFAVDFREEGPYPTRAANLVHLRSDFSFTLPDNRHIGDLLQALHPTPAVCGLPKRDAFRFIIQNEHTPRRYYSGFMGMLDPDGATHLYVSLRCMRIEGRHCHLYAGGGLLRDSRLQQEWQETEAKLETMRRCIATTSK